MDQLIDFASANREVKSRRNSEEADTDSIGSFNKGSEELCRANKDHETRMVEPEDIFGGRSPLRTHPPFCCFFHPQLLFRWGTPAIFYKNGVGK